MVESTGSRIKQRRKELGLTQPDVAKRVGVTKATVSLWENDTNTPNGPNLQALAVALECSSNWLLEGKGSITAPAEPSNAIWMGDIEPWDSTTPLNDDEVELPFFMEVELAAGSGSSQVVESHGPKLRFSKSTLKRKGVDPAQAACVCVSGNSMEPVIPEGTTVGIDTSQTTVSDGKLYAIDTEGWLRIKRLYRIPGGIRVNSYNQEEHPDELYTGDDITRVRVIGRVFWYSVLL